MLGKFNIILKLVSRAVIEPVGLHRFRKYVIEAIEGLWRLGEGKAKVMRLGDKKRERGRVHWVLCLQGSKGWQFRVGLSGRISIILC